MQPLSIKIKISDRIYPMKVQPEDETFVRAASKILADRIKDYQKDLGIQDQQDLLAMVAFDCLVNYLKIQESDSTKVNQLMKKINHWSDAMEEALA
ncbi:MULTISPECIES: cell division protein ZapA [unclassified Candidatus Cardinium]|uniref:cell division protein ZapA n=1 Tax=unclassified Candidatus Cardinium TaxID=2641185 RepID=UPI001FB2B241|nr:MULTISPECIES: cell division protein ZapA [unclassified Candidatus Cardinium]